MLKHLSMRAGSILFMFMLFSLPLTVQAIDSCRAVFGDMPVAEIPEAHATRVEAPSPVIHLRERIGGHLEIRQDQGVNGFDKLILFRNEKKLGWLSFRIDHQTLTIELMYVKKKHRGIGISQALFERIFFNHPEIEAVHFDSLIQDNEAAAEGALAENSSFTEAVTATAAYKICRRFGFSEVSPGSINWNFGFTVTKRAERP